MKRRVRLPIASVGIRPVAVDLRPFGKRRRQALVCRMKTGEVHAYLNECRHLPVPLDALTGRFLTEDGTHFLCRTHGAKYRISDGRCIEGPCEGAALTRLSVRTEDNVYIIEDDAHVIEDNGES